MVYTKYFDINKGKEKNRLKVKSPTVAKINYEDSTALVAKRFEQGVREAEWKDPALAGQDLYEAQMARSEILRRRASGIGKVSNDTWRSVTIAKGKNVIAQRMKDASGKWQQEWAPYGEVLAGIELPPREASGTANVMNRLIPIVEALERRKEELST